MTISFQAVDVHVEITGAHALLGLGSGGKKPDHHIIMMRAMGDGESAGDVLTGEAYLEYRSPAMSGYGCVARAVLSPSKLSLSLDRRRCPQFPDASVEIELTGGAASLQRIQEALEHLIDGPRLTVESAP
ncbi:MAG TPA: hypothetical protein VFV47_03650 [Hyphomicrobiaceae bacterium]|nr:hypothetical protein [Hyphomicrobiaceae bacterium]